MKKKMLSTTFDDERLLEWAREDNAGDLQRCRELLLELDEDDLRSRLSAGTWYARQQEVGMQSEEFVDSRLLQEAAVAFLLATMYKKLMRAGGGLEWREQAVDAVVLAVREMRAELA